MTLRLRPDWYTREIAEHFDLASAGIYEWRIEGVGVYIGKALRLRSRIANYPNNVRRLLQGLHWHGDPNKHYRPVHHALRRAYEEGQRVSVAVLENCDPTLRLERETYWSARRREEALAGGPAVLNA